MKALGISANYGKGDRMAKNTMRPDALTLDTKVKKQTNEIKEVRIVFREGDREFTVKTDVDFLRMIRDVAAIVISRQGQGKNINEEKIPGYM